MDRSVFWILLLLIWFYQRSSADVFASALCFLTKKVHLETFYFAEELGKNMKKDNVDIYIVIDNQNFDYSSVRNLSNIQILNITMEQCISYGYRQTTRLGGDRHHVTAWDKALLHFCVLNKTYPFVWLIEDDVFIPSVQAFRSIHQLYSKTNDLVVRDSQLNLLGKTSYWLWHMAFGNFIPPWSRTMVNVVGLSRRMLETVASEIHWRGISLFHEYFFLTLALQLNMTIVLPSELSTLRPSGRYLWNNITQRPNNFWHPVKNPNERSIWRTKLKNEIFKIKSTINMNELKIISQNDSNMKTIVKDLEKWLLNFEISKVDLLPEDRYLIRKYALDLVEKYQHKNNAAKLISLAKKLANNAYRISEHPLDPLIQNKSSNHNEIERILEKTKDDILRLLSNGSDMSTVEKLRKMSKFLTFDLTYEIRREIKLQRTRQSQTQFPTTVNRIDSAFLAVYFNYTGIKRIQKENFLVLSNVYILIICLLIRVFSLRIIRKRKFFKCFFILLTLVVLIFFDFMKIQILL